MCRCEYHPDEDSAEDRDRMAMYEDMRLSYERFGEHAKVWWASNRCANCSEEIPSPKLASLTADKTGVLCGPCKLAMAQAEFFAKVLAA